MPGWHYSFRNNDAGLGLRGGFELCLLNGVVSWFLGVMVWVGDGVFRTGRKIFGSLFSVMKICV